MQATKAMLNLTQSHRACAWRTVYSIGIFTSCHDSLCTKPSGLESSCHCMLVTVSNASQIANFLKDRQRTQTSTYRLVVTLQQGRTKAAAVNFPAAQLSANLGAKSFMSEAYSLGCRVERDKPSLCM